MSIKINANFELGAAQFLDQREAVETIDELLALNTNIIPDGFEVYVKEKDCKYKYNSTYTESGTGCWKKTESSGASSDSRELTYEEYMKLSEEERNNGTEYYIPDIDDPQISLNPVLWSTPIDGGCILSWQPVKNSVKYEIQKKDNDTWVTLTQTTSMAYLDNTIENETSIEYRLLSYMPDVEEPYVIATVFGSALSGIIPVMSGATSETPGKSGLVPTPESDGYNTKYLRADGTWAVPPDTKYTRMVGSSSSANGKMGLVPAPSKYQQYCFLRADGTWTNPPNTTYDPMTGATNDAAGKQGLVPKPLAGEHNSFLKGDGTWAVPTDTTYDVMTAATASADGKSGLVPAPAVGKQDSFLKGDGTWVVPTDTKYEVMTGATSTTGGTQGLVPAPTKTFSTHGPRFLTETGVWGFPGLNLTNIYNLKAGESATKTGTGSLYYVTAYPGTIQILIVSRLNSEMKVKKLVQLDADDTLSNIKMIADIEFVTESNGSITIKNQGTSTGAYYGATIYQYEFASEIVKPST